MQIIYAGVGHIWKQNYIVTNSAYHASEINKYIVF
jgi:hypothetical protein